MQANAALEAKLAQSVKEDTADRLQVCLWRLTAWCRMVHMHLSFLALRDSVHLLRPVCMFLTCRYKPRLELSSSAQQISTQQTCWLFSAPLRTVVSPAASRCFHIVV